MNVKRACLLVSAILLTTTAGSAWAGGVDVDCGSGGTLQVAIDGAPAGPATVTFAGVCEENVNIERNDLTVIGVDGAQILAPQGTDGPLHVRNTFNVFLESFSLSGGEEYGLRVSNSNRVETKEVSMTDNGRWGAIVIGSQATLRQSEIRDNGAADVTVGGGINNVNSRVTMVGCIVADNPAAGASAGTRRTAVQSLHGSSVKVLNGNTVGEPQITAPEGEGNLAFFVDEAAVLLVRTGRFSGDTYADDESRVEFVLSNNEADSELFVGGSSSVRCENTDFGGESLDEFSVGYFQDCGVAPACTLSSEALCENGEGGGAFDCCD